MKANRWRAAAATMSLALSALLARAEVVDIGNEELKTLLARGVPIVDVRTAGEWRQTGVVEGSRMITLVDEQGRADPADWSRRLDQVAATDRPVVMICRSGNRSGKAAQYLDRAGRKGVVYNVKAGISGWLRDGLPVVSVQENVKQTGISCSPAC